MFRFSLFRFNVSGEWGDGLEKRRGEKRGREEI
jgi:hypothetical protein